MKTSPRTLRFEVFGRIVDLRRSGAGWQVLYPGADGKRVPARDIEIPPGADESSLAGHLADLCHEWAAPGRGEVRRLGEPPGRRETDPQ